MKRSAFVVAAAAILSAWSSARAERLIIAGGGFVGKWDTQIDIANPLSDPMDVVLKIGGLPLGAPCPPNCTGKSYTVPGNGTIRVLASDFIGQLYSGPQMILVDSPDGAPAPTIHARSYSQFTVAQFAELPVVKESSLQAMQPTTLVFPGATHTAGSYSNLILQNVDGSPTQVLIEVFDPQGNLLGSRDAVPVPGESTFQALTIVDVVGAIAGSNGVGGGAGSIVDGGQVRVTRSPGDGVLWGILTTVVGEGSLSVATGATP